MNDDRKTLLYATTNVSRAPNFSQARYMRKDSTSLSIQRTVRNASTLLQRSSLPLLLVLLGNDVHLNPGPFHPRTSEASPFGLKFLYLNARSLKTFAPHNNTDVFSSKVCKITLLQQLVHGAFYDVVCICETWLNESILSSELLQGHSIFCRDRIGKVGGGVVIAVKNGIQATCRLDLEPGIGDNFLHQFIMGPTHIAGNKLDPLLCNYPETIGNVSTLKPQSCNFPTDHYVIEFRVKLKFTRAKPVRRRVYDYKRGNFGDLRNFLTCVPFDITTSDNIDQYWLQWKDIFLIAVESYIPVKTMSDTLHLGLAGSYHKAILHHRENQSPKITYNGITANTAAAKAELFNTYFSSVFLPPKSNVSPDVDDNSSPLSTIMQFSDITLGVEEVEACLHDLDMSKACGPDGIPSCLLKECSREMAPSVCALFNQSLNIGRIPSEWKSANMTPIHKKDLRELAENYRPISLLPILGK
ncbi:Hypothetical predicted protein, partial [Paramuricea clavata]